MNKDEIRAIVKEAAKEATKETLLSFGFNIDEPIEMQKDLQHVRQWRIGCESTKGIVRKLFLTVSIPTIIFIVFGALKDTFITFIKAIPL